MTLGCAAIICVSCRRIETEQTVVMGPVGLLLASVLFWPNEVRSDPAKPKFDVGPRMATARDFSYDENNNDGTHL